MNKNKKDVNTEDLDNKGVKIPKTHEGKDVKNTDNQEDNKEKPLETKVLDEKENLQKDLEEWKDKYIRLVSEFDNYRKRTAKEKLELTMTAAERAIMALLPVIDDFDRALDAFSKNIEAEKTPQEQALQAGVVLIHEKLLKNIEKIGVSTVDCLNQPFDPELCEAIAQIPAPSEELKNCVLDVVEKPYKIHDKVIRYGKVAVGN